MSKKIRTGDRVVVISGNDKGRSGTVMARSETRVVVQGINVRTKHVKKTQQMQSGRITREMPIHISNVAPAAKDGTRIHLRMKGKGRKRELVYRSSEESSEETVYRSMNKPRIS